MKEKELERVNLHAGYPGHDSMREYARQAFGQSEVDGMHADIGKVSSFSSPSRTKMRLYKKGGHVNESKEKKRSHLHQEQMHELNDVKNLIGKEKRLKHGGDVVGGSLTNMHFPKHMGYEKSTRHLSNQKGTEMKRGGHMHKHKRHHDEHEKHGDHHYKHGGHSMEVYDYNMGGHSGNYRHGGHHPHHSSKHRFASGGMVYEREMVGEHESHARPHNNYESMMRGEHCSHHAGSHYEDHPVHRHEVLGGLKHGGHMHGRQHHHKFAAGGVAKIRHGEMTKSGRQIPSGPNRMKVY